MLLSMMEEEEVEYGPPTPFSYKDLFLRFFCSSEEGASDAASDTNGDTSQREPLEPSMPESGIAGIVPKAGEEEPEKNIAAINDTAEKLVQYQEPMHPDIMADVRASVPIEKRTDECYNSLICLSDRSSCREDTMISDQYRQRTKYVGTSD